MADNCGLVGTDGVQNADHVADEVKEGVFLDLLGAIGLAVAAHVRRNRKKAGFRQRPELPAPRVPGFRKSMAEEDEWPASRLRKVDPNSVRLDRSVCYLDHCRRSRLRVPI
jgi:hypothetical protein